MTVPLYQLFDQWGDPTIVYDGIMLNVADGGHADGSDLLDIQLNGVSQFAISAPTTTNPYGPIRLLTDLHLYREDLPPQVRGALALRNGNTPQVLRVYNAYTDDNNWERAGIGWTLGGNILGVGTVNKGTGILRPMMLLASNILLSRSGDPTTISPDTDTGIFRNAAGVLEVNNGAVGHTQGCYLKWGGTAWCAGDVPITNNATLGPVGGLIVNVMAGRTYSIEAELSFTCAPASGIKCAIGGGSATATNIIYDGWIVDSAANGIKGNAQGAALAAPVAAAAITGSAGHVTIRGTIEVNAGGTLQVMAAQNTAGSTATIIKRGSRLIMHDIT